MLMPFFLRWSIPFLRGAHRVLHPVAHGEDEGLFLCNKTPSTTSLWGGQHHPGPLLPAPEAEQQPQRSPHHHTHAGEPQQAGRGYVWATRNWLCLTRVSSGAVRRPRMLSSIRYISLYKYCWMRKKTFIINVHVYPTSPRQADVQRAGHHRGCCRGRLCHGVLNASKWSLDTKQQPGVILWSDIW